MARKPVDLTALYKSVTIPSKLMEGREKMETADIIGEPMTLRELGVIEQNGKEPYVIMVFEQHPDKYLYGGSVVTDKLLRMATAVGSMEEFSDALKEQEFKIKLVTRKSTRKRDGGGYAHYTDIEVCEGG